MKRAFIGLSTPLGYDYRNPIRERQGNLPDIPNPFLESVNGLLLSYDELWFPSREFCPKDLHHLEYVKFIEDSEISQRRALVAIEQAESALPEEMPEAEFAATERQRQIVRDLLPDLALDNHGRGGKFGIGNSADSQLFLNDLHMTASLEFDVDVIINSALARSMQAFQINQHNLQQVDPEYIPKALEDIACVHTLDFVTANGSYHESIEELRRHGRLAEFRQFLDQEAPNHKDFVGLVEEVNRKVDEYAALAMDKYLKGNGVLFSGGSATVGALGTLALGPGGSALSGVLAGGKWLSGLPERKRVGWSMFVLDIRRNQGMLARR